MPCDKKNLKYCKFRKFSRVFYFCEASQKQSFVNINPPRPPIHLLHRIESILCYEEEGAFPMNEMDHKFGKFVFFSKQYKF